MKAHVWVMPKKTVLDPQGQTIHNALRSLGYSSVKEVRQGKFFVISLGDVDKKDATAHFRTKTCGTAGEIVVDRILAVSVQTVFDAVESLHV